MDIRCKRYIKLALVASKENEIGTICVMEIIFAFIISFVRRISTKYKKGKRKSKFKMSNMNPTVLP